MLTRPQPFKLLFIDVYFRTKLVVCSWRGVCVTTIIVFVNYFTSSLPLSERLTL